MKRHFIWRPFVVLAATGALLAGCATTQSETAPTVKEDPQALLTTTYALIDAIAQQAPAWVRSGPVLVATFVDVDQLDTVAAEEAHVDVDQVVHVDKLDAEEASPAPVVVHVDTARDTRRNDID